MSKREDHRRQYCVRPSRRRGSAPAPRALALVGLLCAAAALPACGGGERSFTAQDFVEAANEHGARLELGGSLDAGPSGGELYEVRILDPAATATPPGAGIGTAGATGTLLVSGGVGAAEDEYRRCESAASLFCYRAANVVLIFEQDSDPGLLGAVAEAIRALESE